MNLNKLAREVTLKEGMKKSISIAQVKEVMRILLQELSKLPPYEIQNILMRYVK